MGNRYPALDAMRGCAAIVVVIYHSAVVTDAACTQPTCNVPFGYLAVDMFFALSGFVLAHAYDPRFAAGMTPWSFMKQRLMRLLPVYWLALLIGLPLVAIDARAGTVPLATIMTTTLFNMLIFPWNVGATSPYAIAFLRSAWSLFFELWVANLVFALGWRWLRGVTLAILIGLSLAGLAGASRAYGNLDIGPVWATFPGGFPRVLFAFFLGVALHRMAPRLPLPGMTAPAVIAIGIAAFFAPVPATGRFWAELVGVALICPSLILIGSRATIRNGWLTDTLGAASYPLYLVHIPMLDYLTRAMRRFAIAPHPAIAVLFVGAAMLIAMAIGRYYDVRARSFLASLVEALPRRSVGSGGVGSPVPAGGAIAYPGVLAAALIDQP